VAAGGNGRYGRLSLAEALRYGRRSRIGTGTRLEVVNTFLPDDRLPDRARTPAPAGGEARTRARLPGALARTALLGLVCASVAGASLGARAQVVIGGTGSAPASSDSVIVDQGVLDALRGGSPAPAAPAPAPAAPAPRRTAPAPDAPTTGTPTGPQQTTTARRFPFAPPPPPRRPERAVAAATEDRPDPIEAPTEPSGAPATRGAEAAPVPELPQLDTSTAAAPRVEPPSVPAPQPPPPRPRTDQPPLDAPAPSDVAPDPAPPAPPIVAERPPRTDGADDAPPAGRRVVPAPQTGAPPSAEERAGGGQTAALPPSGESVATLPDNQGFRIVFDEETSAFTDSAGRLLTGLAQRMTDEPDMRLQVRAYAGGTAESASRARRLSLDRALAVRTFLLDRGVEATRIDVRALGNTAPEPPADRVDLLVSG